MTRRAKLSLDPKQQTKTAPPHGFEQRAPDIADEVTARADAAPVARSVAGPGKAGQRVRGRWQAHRPQAGAGAGSDAGAVPPEPVSQGAASIPATHMASRLTARVRELSRRPMVRAVAVGAAAGLALLLLRRRLF